jgi:hypothetical protein
MHTRVHKNMCDLCMVYQSDEVLLVVECGRQMNKYLICLECQGHVRASYSDDRFLSEERVA